MGVKRIKFSLSTASVRSAMDELRAYKKWTQEKCDELALELAKRGTFLIRMKIAEYDAIDTGALISAVSYPEQIGPGRYRISLRVDNGVGDNYALFVEYGTGVVGASSPHPEAGEAGWNYASGETIFTTKDGRVGWIYPKGDGTFRFTEGQKARPYWHDAAKELPLYINDAVRKVFGNG